MSMNELDKTAVQATLHCLTGCAAGEVVGMIMGNALDWHGATTILSSIGLAFIFGYSFSIVPLLSGGLGLRQSLKVALAADTVSIATMELADNAIMVVVPGAMNAGLASLLFWGSLACSLFVAFWVTVPVNRWLIARGKGHAVAHAYHHAHHESMSHEPDHDHSHDTHASNPHHTKHP